MEQPYIIGSTDPPSPQLLGFLSKPTFLGISLSSVSHFSKSTISAYCQFLQGYSRSFVVLIADSLEISNYEHFLGLSEIEASSKSLRVGKQFLRGYQKLMHVFPSLRIMLLSEIYDSPEIQYALQVLRKEFKTNANFQAEVETQIRKNLGTRLDSEESIDSNLSEYLLGEYAVCIALHKGLLQSEPTQVSPKPDHLLSSLYQGMFPQLTESLQLKANEFQYVVLLTNGGDMK